MSHILKFSFSIFLSLGCGLTIAGVGGWLQSRAVMNRQNPLVVSPNSLVVVVPKAVSRMKATFEVTNTSDQPVRLLGSAKRCLLDSCVMLEPIPLPLEIPPKATRSVVVRITSSGRADFVNDYDVYTDNPTQPAVFFHVKGSIDPAMPVGLNSQEGILSKP